MSSPEKFVEWVTNQPTTLTNLAGSNFGASGANHSVGLVPDPGNSAGTTKFLREDGTWQTISTSSVLPAPTRAGDIIYWNGSAWVTLAGNNSGTQILQETSAGVPSWTTLSFAPTYQSFLSGSGNYTPTSASVVRIKVRMVGGGGGGSASSTNDGQPGGQSSFDSWTANGGNGGLHTTGTAAGGTGGTNGGTGTLIVRISGSSGSGLISSSEAGFGGDSVFAGAGKIANSSAGGNAVANTGSGGAGSSTGAAAGGGGGAGEYVEFVYPSPGVIPYTVGALGAGGVAGGTAGGNGAAGIILIEEFYL